ncbi:hypothetical protein CC86DRAFT_162661 [Ophiobolus disseminans]|uniref:Xylanolytic transcriptional activator regulatory domain-containing protein n=1 Tax=Ophiobolus disseminans TaxID=1469910 RepID=A0A6A7ACD9_9PLEO|nr:hypothetical protein CC86DRAFT_162661 [Ophiobolus disseminans]
MEGMGNGTPTMASATDEERPSKRRRTSGQPHREVGLMRSVPGDKLSGFVGSASGIFFIKSVYSAIRNSQNMAPTAGETPVSDVVPGEDDQLPSILPHASERLWKDDEIASTHASTVSFQDLVELSGSYFANWHMFYPFLHAPTVLDHFEQFSCDESSNLNAFNDLRVVILRSIMSISLADQRQADHPNKSQYPKEVVFSSYDQAVDSLQHVLTSPTSLLGLQAAISVQLFLVSMLRLNAASRLGGLINRMALQLGLHRCPTRYSSFSAGEKEIRQRIFWTLYAIDRFICQSMGLPLGINDDDVDVCFPTTERHSNGRHELLSGSFQLKLLDFIARESRLRGDIIELRNKSLHYVQKDPDQATAIAAKLAQWWNDIEELQDADHNQRLSSYHLTTLKLLKHEAIISLHRPILAASRRGVEYDAALQLCIGSARSLIMLLHSAISTGDDRLGFHEPLYLLWPSCTWGIWISTFILFYAASNDQLSPKVVIRLAERSLQVLQHLARRGSAWPEASAAAIRDLRSRMIERQDNTLPTVHEPIASSVGLSGSLNHSHQNAHGGTTDTATLAPESPPHTESIADYGLSGTGHTIDQTLDGVASTGGDVLSWQSQSEDIAAQRHRNNTLDVDLTAFNSVLQGDQPFHQGFGTGNVDALDPFSGFDIPFWFEQDQHWDVFQDFN